MEVGLPLEDQGRSVPRSVQSAHVEHGLRQERSPTITTTSRLNGEDVQAWSYENVDQSINRSSLGHLSPDKMKKTKKKKGNGCDVIDELFSSIEEGSRRIT